MCDSIILMTITLQPPYKDHPSDRLTFFPKKGTGFLANPYVIISDGPPEWQKKDNGQRRSAPCHGNGCIYLVMSSTSAVGFGG